MTVYPNPALYTHDPTTGYTTIKAVIPQPGKYEIFAWPDYVEYEECGPNKLARGSGEVIISVESERAGSGVGGGLKGTEEESMRDWLRSCEMKDYWTDLGGRWVSLGHIKEKYNTLDWVIAHKARSGEYFGSMVTRLAND